MSHLTQRMHVILSIGQQQALFLMIAAGVFCLRPTFFWMFFQLFLATICYRRTCSFTYFLLNNYFNFIAYSICMVLIFLFVVKNSRWHGSSTNQWRESKKFSCWSCYKYWAGQVPCCHTCLCISCGSHSCVPLAMLGMDVARVLDMFMILHTYQSCWFYLYIAPRL